ncbi:unnamed protein product [Phyllotreta striolata]|uniref:Uncharacterized protein n=1 Tax=Phyllotreta striolata TaxID=444603 RepID=A0A9N9TCM2_PHYSR|nr:unnamed protein product [Phyllotreta striolata]
MKKNKAGLKTETKQAHNRKRVKFVNSDTSTEQHGIMLHRKNKHPGGRKKGNILKRKLSASNILQQSKSNHNFEKLNPIKDIFLEKHVADTANKDEQKEPILYVDKDNMVHNLKTNKTEITESNQKETSKVNKDLKTKSTELVDAVRKEQEIREKEYKKYKKTIIYKKKKPKNKKKMGPTKCISLDGFLRKNDIMPCDFIKNMIPKADKQKTTVFESLKNDAYIKNTIKKILKKEIVVCRENAVNELRIPLIKNQQIRDMLKGEGNQLKAEVLNYK